VKIIHNLSYHLFLLFVFGLFRPRMTCLLTSVPFSNRYPPISISLSLSLRIFVWGLVSTSRQTPRS
jgi:hypothetical protein